MFQVSFKNIWNFSRNSYFQVGGRHVRVLIIVCAIFENTNRVGVTVNHASLAHNK